MDKRITMIHMEEGHNNHEHISAVAIDGQSFPRQNVINDIDAKLHTFYVYDAAKKERANVGVRRPAGRAAYIQTYADNDWNDNLLSLPRY